MPYTKLEIVCKYVFEFTSSFQVENCIFALVHFVIVMLYALQWQCVAPSKGRKRCSVFCLMLELQCKSLIFWSVYCNSKLEMLVKWSNACWAGLVNTSNRTLILSPALFTSRFVHDAALCSQNDAFISMFFVGFFL